MPSDATTPSRGLSEMTLAFALRKTGSSKHGSACFGLVDFLAFSQERVFLYKHLTSLAKIHSPNAAKQIFLAPAASQ
jgi:hypothetical protein